MSEKTIKVVVEIGQKLAYVVVVLALSTIFMLYLIIKFGGSLRLPF